MVPTCHTRVDLKEPLPSTGESSLRGLLGYVWLQLCLSGFFFVLSTALVELLERERKGKPRFFVGGGPSERPLMPQSRDC